MNEKPLNRLIYTSEITTESTGIHECEPECDCTCEMNIHCDLSGDEYQNFPIFLESDVRSAVEGIRGKIQYDTTPEDMLDLLTEWFPTFVEKKEGTQ